MSELLPKELKNALPKIGDQEGNKNPTVYAVFQFPLSGWAWFVTEGDAFEDDICFFGYVVGRGHCLSVCISTDWLKIERWTGCEWKLKHLPELPARRYCHH